VCFIAGYLLNLRHIGWQLKTSHPRPQRRPDLQLQIWPGQICKKNQIRCNPNFNKPYLGLSMHSRNCKQLAVMALSGLSALLVR